MIGYNIYTHCIITAHGSITYEGDGVSWYWGQEGNFGQCVLCLFVVI